MPDLDEVVDKNFTEIQKSLNDAREAVKPAPNSQGIAADILEGLGRFAPAIGATVAAGPVAGGAVAFGSSLESTKQDFLAKGVDEDTAGTLALEQASADALGMALPAGLGARLATRLLSGVAINTSFGAANRFALGETLEDNGYEELAKQYRVWDKQAMLVDGVLGATFGGVHHLTAQRADTALADTQSTSPDTINTESSTTSANDAPPVADTVTAQPEVTYESRMAELQQLSDQVISRGDRKALSQQVYDCNTSMTRRLRNCSR